MLIADHEHRKMDKGVLSVAIFLVFICLLIMEACSSQPSEDNDQAKVSSESQQIVKENEDPNSFLVFGDLSKDYLDQFDISYSQARNGADNDEELDCLLYLYRVVEINGSDITLTPNLAGNAEKNDSLLIRAHPTKLKVFLDGQPADLKDINPGYLLSFYGKDMAVNLVAISDENGNFERNPLENATYISAWTANQSD